MIGSLCSSGLESAYSHYPSLSKLLCLLELEEAGSEVNRLGFECEVCVARTCVCVCVCVMVVKDVSVHGSGEKNSMCYKF